MEITNKEGHLTVNAGSSSLKLKLFIKNERHPIWTAHIDWEEKKLSIFYENQTKKENIENDHKKALITLGKRLPKISIKTISHRIVHGADHFKKAVLITQDVKNSIKELIPLAPLHNPIQLETIKIFEELFKNAIQTAHFDTAFFQTLDEKVKTYPLPLSFKKHKIQKYGFHGLSHNYCTKKALELTGQKNIKIICCHLGAGASVSACFNTKAIDTTMGFTPLDGLMMAKRPGSIDPGIIPYLLREKLYSLEEIDQILEYESGLKGICKTDDMREILSQKDQDPLKKLAYEMYIHRLQTHIAQMVASLQGIDLLIFTGGIGENSAEIREAACQGLHYLNLKIDPPKNKNDPEDENIATKESLPVFVIKTDEEWEMIKEMSEILAASNLP